MLIPKLISAADFMKFSSIFAACLYGMRLLPVPDLCKGVDYDESVLEIILY